jgi:hypothetical protein
MPDDNRVKTFNTSIDSLDKFAFGDINELQDKLVMMWEANQEEGTLPTDFLGAHCVYGEWTVANGDDDIMDYSWNYWTHAPMDWRQRQCLAYVVEVLAPSDLPSSATHSPNKAGSVLTIAYDLFNTKAGLAIGGGATAYEPFGIGTQLYIYPDSTDGILYCTNDTGAAVYFYGWFMFSKSITTNNIGEHRIRSYADCAQVTPYSLNEFQDRSQMLVEANQEEGALPATFLGGTWITGEYTIAAGADKIIDNSRDWRGRMADMVYRDVLQGNNRLPSKANHTPNLLQNKNYLYWNTKTGVAVGGPFGAGTNAWAPVANVDIYVDNVNGYLYCTNSTGAPIEIYLQVLFTGTV